MTRTAATAIPRETNSARQDDLRAGVDELERAIERLKDSAARTQIRSENLMAERGPLVVPARSGKSPEAQKRVREIDQELESLRPGIADDETAILELEAQLVCAQDALSMEKWEAERARLRALLVERLKSDKVVNLQKRAADLIAAVKEIKEEDAQLGAEIAAFDRRARFTGMEDGLVGGVIAWDLFSLLPRDCFAYLSRSYHGKSLLFYDERSCGAAIESLDRLDFAR